MARTTINPTQISITGSNASAISEGSLTATHVFMAQAASTSAVQTITADAMQKYFSQNDLLAAGDVSHRVILTSVADGADDVDLRFDAGILYNPTGSGTLTLTGDLEVGDDLTLGSDSAVITAGSGVAAVTLTHVSASTPALRLQAAKKLSFGDEDTFVQQSTDGELQVQADSKVDINGGEIDIDGAAINIDATSGLSLQAAAASDFTVSSGDLSLIADADDAKVTIRSDVTGSAVAIHLDGNAGAGAIVDIDGGDVDIDATDAVTIDGVSVSLDGSESSNFSIAANNASTQTLNFSATNSHASASANLTAQADGVLSLQGEGGINIGTSTDAAIDIDSSTLDIDASGAVTIDSTSTIVISGDGGATFSDDVEGLAYDGSGNVDFDAVALDIDASGAITIDGASTAALRAAGAVTVSGSALTLNAASGSVDVDATAAVSIDTSDTSNGVKIATATSGVPVTIGHSTSEVTVADNLNVNGAAIIAGNLTVNGTTTTVNSTTLTVDDTIIVLGQGNSAETKDLGLILERSGSDSNVALFWDESVDYFQLMSNLSEDGSADTIAAESGSYAELRLGNLVAAGNVDLGDATSDTITATGRFDSDLVPSSDNARDLGTSALQWKDLHLNGTANLDVVDIDGATQIDATVTVGTSGTGYDVTFNGPSGSFQWDASADDLILSGAAGLIVPDGQLTLEATAVTSTAAELNVLDGYAEAAYSNTADFIVFADADAATGNHDLRRESTSDFLTAIAGDGLSVEDSKLKTNVPAEEFFQSASTTFVLAVAPSLMVDNSLAVYLNGMLQLASGSITGNAGDYYTSGSNLVMTDALDADDVLIVRYVSK